MMKHMTLRDLSCLRYRPRYSPNDGLDYVLFVVGDE
jgi:hypothetical protein